MIETEVDVRERTVEVSPEALGKVFPPLGLIGEPDRGSRLARLIGGLKIRSRVVFARVLFRMVGLRPLRCRIVEWRLWAKLTWIKIRHRRSLMGPR